MLGINLGGLPKLSNVKCVTKHLPDKNFEQLVIEADVSFLPATPEEEVVAFAQAPSRKFSVTLTKLVGRACIAYQSTPAAIISVSFKPKVDIAFKLSTDSHVSCGRSCTRGCTDALPTALSPRLLRQPHSPHSPLPPPPQTTLTHSSRSGAWKTRLLSSSAALSRLQTACG